MAPNLVIETHHGEGVVTTRPPPENKFYLGKVSSHPDSLVALRSDGGLVRMTFLFSLFGVVVAFCFTGRLAQTQSFKGLLFLVFHVYEKNLRTASRRL